ncbi:AraC family transcriptional regulator [Aquiflexum sp.]|uniref:AraC family transcriptional regulator n=1 Tax=Aquiflexum sp. TaxID=1872584 RepID=UPI00359430E4
MMPLFLKKNTTSLGHSFLIEKFQVPHTYDIWHHHTEFEFFHMVKGSGTRFIGDSIESFTDGDLVLVGPNLPHVWRSDKCYYASNPNLNIELILTQFLPDFLGKDFLNLSEMHELKIFLEDANQGIQIIGPAREMASTRLFEILNLQGSRKLIAFISLLADLASSKSYRKLSTSGFSNAYQSRGSQRIKKVHDFIMNNFMEDISLSQAAEVANMNETAFCRFFKNSTLKTFTQFLNEVRIGYACKLLLNEDLNVASVGFESGFKNISYFNRVFKYVLGVTPQQYQKSACATNQKNVNFMMLAERFPHIHN